MEPRYTVLARELIQNISEGRFAVGASLPTEIELSRQYGVSRSTVRSALKMVQDLGLISRKKKAGIRVESNRPSQEYAPSLSSIEDLMQYAVETERNVQKIEEIVCDDALAKQLQCKPGQRWLRISSIRTEPEHPDTPLSWTDVYVDPDLGAGVRSEVCKGTGLICEMIEERYGRVVAEVRQQIRAIGLPARLAQRLDAEPGAHALEITRHYLDQAGRAFEISVSVHPADRFTYAFNLRRQKKQTED